MKVITIAAVAIAVGITARADQVTVHVQDPPVVSLQVNSRLVVYVARQGDVPAMIVRTSKDLAVKILRNVGIDVEWRSGDPTPNVLLTEQPVIVKVVSDQRVSGPPGVLAYAMPYEGAQIRVLYHRIARNHPEEYEAQVVLAYVLVHEIAHLLQGVARHSDSGIMKKLWAPCDIWAMRTGKLSFEPLDLELIRDGLTKRALMPATRVTPGRSSDVGF